MKAYYRLALKADDSTYWAVVGGIPVKQTTPYYMSYGVLDGWGGTGVIDERNLRMMGFTRKYTEDSYIFVGRAHDILWHVWKKEGANANIILRVETLRNNSYVLDYETNLSLATALKNNHTFQVKLLEEGIAAKIRSREDVVYELPVTPAVGARNVDISSQRVIGKYKFLTEWPVRAAGGVTASFSTTAQMFKIAAYFVDRTFVEVSNTPANEPVSNNPAANNNYITGQDFENMGGGGFYGNQYNYLFKANIDIKAVVVKTTIPFYVANNSATNSRFMLSISKMDNSGFQTNLYSVYSGVINAGASANFSLELDNTISPVDLAAGDALILEATMETSAARDINIAWEPDFYVNVKFEHYTDSFTCMHIPWKKVGEMLIDRITDGEASFVSNLLTSFTRYEDNFELQPQNLVMLSGDSIRGVVDPVLKISLKDYLKASQVLMGASFGLEGTEARMEKTEYFFKDGSSNKIATIKAVKDDYPEITHATDFHYNEIHIGFKEYEYDGLNGKDEPNTTHRYLTPITNDKNVCDMISPVRADGYGIFDTWVNYAFSQNKDSKSDNDLFALQVKPNPFGNDTALYPQDINAAAVVTGVIDPTRLMNVGLTPLKCLLRNGRFIRSWFHGNDGAELKWQATTRNHDLISKITRPLGYVEDANIPFSSLGARIFYPFYIVVQCDSTENYKSLWETKRNGNFEINTPQSYFVGFPIRSQDRNKKPKLTELKLLAAPSVNPETWR